MKVALIKPCCTYSDWYRRPVLGISYISAYLENNGFDCKIFDAYFYSWTPKELLAKIINYKPNVIGITAMTHEIYDSALIAKYLKNRLKIPIIIGGCHVTALPERTLKEFPIFDYVVYGEGEKTMLELLNCLKNNGNLKTIKGIAFRDEKGNICINSPRPFLTSEELDSLPYPAFHHYYGNNSSALKGRDSYYVMITSRGCPYNCAFCMQILGKKVRRRSAQNVYQEIEYAISRYGAHTFDFADEIFLFDNQETRKLLKLMIENKLNQKIRWSGLTRANFVTSELIALAKKAGCYRLEMGVESGDNEILRNINKAITIEQVKKACEIIKKAGIFLKTYFIVGHPNETKKSLQKTCNLAKELNTHAIAVGMMVPYPGTKIYRMAQKGEGGYKLLTQDWREYDKYGGKVLELENIPYNELVNWQKKILISLYLKNLRLISFLKYIWKMRKGIFFLLKKLGEKRK